jgi:hypothetical protein
LAIVSVVDFQSTLDSTCVLGFQSLFSSVNPHYLSICPLLGLEIVRYTL